MNTATQVPKVTDRHLRGARILIAEKIITRYADGEFNDLELAAKLGRLADHPEPGPYIQDAVEAFQTWRAAETGDYDVRALDPDLQDEAVYAERCRTLLDEAIEELVWGAR